MADLNFCVFIGRVGRDPEVRNLPSGEAVCSASIAVSRRWKDKASGETKEQTTWVPLSMFGKTAELFGQYAKKGSQVRVNEMNAPGYEQLADVLARAYDQAARGKGRERHANDKPFHLQPMQDLIRLHGVGFATGQASKKASEALGLPTVERQVAELLGAIVYLAGAVIALERQAADGR